MNMADTDILIDLSDSDMRDINDPEPKPFILKCGHDTSEWLHHTVNISVWDAIVRQQTIETFGMMFLHHVNFEYVAGAACGVTNYFLAVDAHDGVEVHLDFVAGFQHLDPVY